MFIIFFFIKINFLDYTRNLNLFFYLWINYFLMCFILPRIQLMCHRSAITILQNAGFGLRSFGLLYVIFSNSTIRHAPTRCNTIGFQSLFVKIFELVSISVITSKLDSKPIIL